MKNKVNKSKLPMLEVWLDGSVKSVKGLCWPRSTEGSEQLASITAYEKPCQVCLHFPSGKHYTFKAKYVTLEQKKGLVESVGISPRSGLTSFADALNEVETLARNLGILTKPLIRKRFKRWREFPPRLGVSTGAALEKGVEVFIELLPYDINSEEWYSVLSFYKAEEKG
jgi:hypothetical protein